MSVMALSRRATFAGEASRVESNRVDSGPLWHAQQAQQSTRVVLLPASGSLRVCLVVPITAGAAAGPETLLGWLRAVIGPVF
jgi:hypothetical protein